MSVERFDRILKLILINQVPMQFIFYNNTE